MQAFESLKQFFQPRDTTIALPGDPFIEIDRDRAIKNLNLDERAEKNGKANQPPTESTAFDAVEAEIEAEIAGYANRAQIEAQNNHKVYSQRLSSLALLRELSSITGASEQALGDFNKTVIDTKSRLAIARDAIEDSFKWLADFKKEHGLSRPAHKQLNPVYAWSAILLAWLVEAFANTMFLRVNDDYGLVGGFVAAIIVAAINVLVSALIGRKVFPYAFHKDRWRRNLAFAGSILWVVLLLIWNLLAAHFRDAKGLGVESPEIEALKLFVQSPFGLTSIYSYGLLIAGLVFAVIAALSAFKMDDPYPGYGEVFRRHEERCEEYSDTINEAMEELQEIRDEGIDEARSVRNQLRAQFGERGQIIAARQAHKERFTQYQDYLEEIAYTLLMHYRSKNEGARSDPAPKRFDEKWRLQRVELVVPQEPSIDDEVARAQATLDKSIEKISAAFDQAIKSFESLDQIKRSLANG